MWYELIQALVAPAIVFFATAADAPIVPLPQAFDTTSLVSSRLLAQNFSTNPQLAQAEAPPAVLGQPAPQLDVKIVNFKQCVNRGFHLTYRIVVRNRGVIPLFDVVTQNQYPAGTTYRTGDRLPDEVNELIHIITWREGFLAPGAFVSYTFTVRVDTAGGVMVNNVTVTARDALGRDAQAFSDHRIPAGCTLPVLAPAAGQSVKQGATICDPAEIGCVQVLPNLGINFQRAQQPEEQVRICAPGDPRGCAPNRPDLGVRFREAIADIQPGDCRVLPDNIISTPDFQDALTRRTEPSAFYLAPLYEAGQNFRKLILENALLGIEQAKKAQSRLQDLRAPGEIAAVLQQLENDYQDMQQQRKDKFNQELVDQTVNQAIESIRRACGGDQANNIAVINLRRALATVKEAYDANLDLRAEAYHNTLQIFLQQSPAKDRSTFDELFARTFAAHQKQDEVSDDQIRREWWEVALDESKGEATACEAENVFAPDVERTWCESNNYFPPRNLVAAPNGVVTQSKVGQVAPPDTQALTLRGPQAQLQRLLVEGVACGGGPGDPWWADDCSCHCGQVLPGAPGVIRTCQNEKNITKRIVRHDINVQDPHGNEQLSQEECLAEGVKHNDLFF